MKLIGLDNGYNFTKTSKGVSILSTIIHGIDDINSDTLQVKIDGEDYIVGDANGAYVTDADKLKSSENKELLKVCTLTAIGLSFPDEPYIEVEVVAGLPIGYYSNQKEELKILLESYNEKILINTVGIEQRIRITKASIYPQSAGVVFSKSKQLKNQSSLVIDIGGGTWDVSQFDGLKVIKKGSYPDGMLILYSKIAQFLNTNYYTKYNTSEIYNLIQRGNFTCDGDKISISVVDEVINTHIQKVLTDIKRDFDTTNVDNKFAIGGGAEQLKDLLKREFRGIQLEENAQFANAEHFEFIGRIKR